MLCSILIPTRARTNKLRNAIKSIFDHASGRDFEVLLRVDDDDKETKQVLGYLTGQYKLRVITGPHIGWSQIDPMLTELSDQSTGTWVWLFNDDGVVVSGKWDAELAKVPTTGFIVQPELFQLGNSVYRMAEAQAFPIVPRNCWREFGLATIPHCADTALHSLLTSHGWKTHFMKVSLWHDRDSPAEITRYRKRNAPPEPEDACP